MMTGQQLQNTARWMANSAFVRYWLHWNYPTETPWMMAIEIRDFENGALVSMECYGMEKLGFEWDEVDRRYYVERDVVADGLTKYINQG